MLDHYGSYPGPSKESGCDEIFTTMITRHNSAIRHERQMRYHINKIIDTEIVKYGGLGSYTGWNVTTRFQIMKQMKPKISLIERSASLWKKLRIFTMVIGKFIVAKNIRFMYRPGGDYMLQIEEKYRDTFNS